MMAAQHAYHEVIRVLLAHGADVNAMASDGYTAFVYADWWVDPQGTADLLLEAGATGELPYHVKYPRRKEGRR